MGDENRNNNGGDSKANLARIRDNQRRSRARRKEYLQELEAKYRQCEQLGVSATAEMQVAARRVLEENRKLRALLKSRGVSDDDIDTATGADTEWLEEGSPAEKLEFILTTRKACCAGGGSDNNTVRTTCSPRRGTSPALTQQPLSAGLHPPPQLASLSINGGPLSAQPRASPIAASTMTYPTIYQAPSQPYNSAPTPTAAAYSYSYPANDNNPQWQVYEAQPEASQALPNYGSTSCVDAASIIRDMRAGVGAELEADLGCSQPGVNCKVENMVVFEVMEKYTSQGTDAWK